MSEAEAFIDRWAKSGGAERANYQLFLTELAELIGAPKLEVAQQSEEANRYVFEKAVRFKHSDGSTTTGYIDLYKRDCFVCEAKQSVKEGKPKADAAQTELFGEEAGRKKTGTAQVGTPGWDLAMERARRQAEGYAKALPKEHGWPPFLMIVDVGYCIELYADFSGQGKNYAQFPDRRSFRIMLADLAQEEVRERLKLVWTEPHALDPAKQSAKVTREIAERLAIVATELEGKHDPHDVALFLMRCLFTMFAEDVSLLPKKGFENMLKRFKGRAKHVQNALTDLWQKMDRGGFSAGLEEDVRWFNGGLFRNATALPVTEEILGELIVAARRDWRDVEPAIFGTLLERALRERERAQLGAHYTPRAYVERLVVPTIMEPLQEDWAAARVEAQQALDAKDKDRAIAAVRAFHAKLCNTRVLDPACGTGNFLYVAMELMKRLEGEVLDYMDQLGAQTDLELGGGEAKGKRTTNTVDPHNFLGIEKNPRAKEIAELVLWIGYLKWQLRTAGPDAVIDPVLRDFKTIENRDAILAFDRQEMLIGEDGRPITKWDGRTMKLHPITGEEIPDEEAREELYRYANPRIASWPEAEFIVGNPPFIGKGLRFRDALGDGYAEALWQSRSRRPIPRSADLVMYWWEQAAHLLAQPTSKLRQFGFVTTNSITQSFNSRVLASYLRGEAKVSLVFAIPDHPWVKGDTRANVRIAMTVGAHGDQSGKLNQVTSESGLDTDSPTVALAEVIGTISPDLRLGADLSTAKPLRSNESICANGVALHGQGFVVTPALARDLIRIDGGDTECRIRPYYKGSDLTDFWRPKYVIDMEGLDEAEVRSQYPRCYEILAQKVKPERDQNREESRKRLWWLFGRRHTALRSFLSGLSRFIATTETTKHRHFTFLPGGSRPDHMVVSIGSDDAGLLAMLSSHIHVTWALENGGTLEDRPRYNKTKCFDPFPFPTPPPRVRKDCARSARSWTPSARRGRRSIPSSRSRTCTTCSRSSGAAIRSRTRTDSLTSMA